MKKFGGYFAIIAFLFFLSLIFYSIDEIFIRRTLPEAKNFEIKYGEGADSVIGRLGEEGIIRNEFITRGYLVIVGIHRDIKPGIYTIGPYYSTKEIFDGFIKGGGLNVLLSEGLTIKEMARIFQERGIVGNSAEFERLASAFDNSAGRYAFLPRSPKVNLEGYLFPDTYQFGDVSTKEVIETILDNFESKVYSRFKNAVPRDFNETIIMASMLEEEVRTQKDMKLVSGILRKRLETGIALQVDATLVYIKCSLLNRPDCRSIANTDKEIKSLYNTYLYSGLPPGPISNPGLLAIEAVFDPEGSPYLYYLSARDDGRTIFSRTLEEHNLNRAVYR